MSNSVKKGLRMRRILAFLSPYWKTAAFILTLTLLTAGLTSVSPLIHKRIVDSLTNGLTAPDTWHIVVTGILVLVGIAILRELVTSTSNYLAWKLRLKTNFNLMDSAVGRIFNLSLSYHQNEMIGSLMTRLDKGINGFNGAIFDVCFTVLPSLLYLGCAAFFMITLSWKLSIVALIFAPLPALIGVFASGISSRREKKLLDKWTAIYSRFHESLNLIKTVKSFCMEDGERKRFLTKVDETNNLVAKGVLIDSVFGSSKNMLTDLGHISILGYGAYLIMQHEITIGTLVAFLSYTGGLFAPMLGLAGMYETFRKAKVYLETIFDIIDTPQSVEDVPGARALSGVKGAVAFNDVRFGYRPNEPVLKGVTFSVKAGQRVAIVGPSGAGKTTIIDLLNRYYDPQSGSVTIDGADIRGCTQHSVRHNIGMVLQDTSLFNDTLGNNIACARPDASQEEIVAAARAANAARFIDKTPLGYDTNCGERGQLLSGGERQRIAIARAILKDAKILVFDEASSNLDAESERLVQEAIERLGQDKTVFVIAHRLSTVKKADLILVVDGGRIVEQGKHDELVALKGLYSHLVEIQSLSPQSVG